MLEVHTDVQEPNETLVQRARGGDASALEELFRLHRGDAYRVAFRLLGNEQDALDAVQDGLLKAFSALRGFDGRSEFRTWLLRIVTNAALDGGRRRKRRSWLSLGSEATPVEPAARDEPDRRLKQQDLRRTLDAALNRLSPKLRATFVLFAELGMSYREIAETQEVPIGTVMSRINAAREELQAALDWEQLHG
jgi:RNA polymerase sigma-70 factor (ECF subfamily)